MQIPNSCENGNRKVKAMDNTVSGMLYVTAADVHHINRICGDVDYWFRACQKTDDRLMPPELLIGYTKNLLWYWRKPYMHRGRIKCMATLEHALKQISNRVLAEEWQDMETRMTIIRMMHDAGYGVQYPAAYRL